MNFDPGLLTPYLPDLAAGARLTALACALALAGAVALGLLVALMRTAAAPLPRRIAAIYVDIFRNVPFLVQLFFFFYGLPVIGLELSAFATGVLAMAVAGGAFTSDVLRAGILAIEPGVLEAAEVSGLSRAVIVRKIMLPIALRTSVRPLGSVFVNLILTSSILSAITVNELTGTAKIVAAETFAPFEVYAALLVAYAVLTYAVALSAGVLHRRLNVGPLMRFTDFTPYDLVLLLQGLGVSVGLFIASTLLGGIVGLAWALLRYYRVPVLAQVAAALAELLKNSPVLVQLFLVFFGLPVLLQTDLTPVQAALITLSGNTAAFLYVIAVSSIEAVGREQLETARVFGLGRWQILRHVVAPQAAAFALGPLTGLLVNQLQVTSLISVVGVLDLTKMGVILNLRTLKPFIVWTVVGLLYYLLAKLIARVCGALERRLRVHSAWKGMA